MSKILIIIFIFFLKINSVNALDLTLYVNNWLNEIPETYNVHTNEYIYLENKTSSTLSDILNESSSFNAVRSGPQGSQTSLFTRGTNSNHTLVTINGSPITDHTTSNGLADLGVIDTSFSSRLHLIDGPMGTLYGPNAVGGVIDIQKLKNYSNKISAIIGSRGKKNFSLKNNFGDSKQYGLGIVIEESEGISVYPQGDEKDGFALNSFNFSYMGNYNNTNYDLLFLRNNQDMDLDASGSDDLDYTGNTIFNFLQYNSNTNLTQGKINLVLDYNSWEREYNNGSERDNYYSENFHLKSVYLFQNNKINNAIGYDQVLYSADFTNRGSYNSSVNKNADQLGFFNNSDVKLNKNLTLSGGYRIDNSSHFGVQETYRIGANYGIDKYKIFNSYSSGYKNPTLYEMYGADNFGYKGNSELKPEKSFNSELGFVFDNEYSNLKFSIFDTSIKDMISYANSTYSNDFNGSSKMQGFDIDTLFKIGNLKLINSYSNVHAVDSENTWLKRRPHDIFYSSLNYQNNNLSITPELNFYGKHSDTHSSNYSTILINERTIFDLNISYGNFLIEIQNILNDKYERPHGYNQGGIEINLKYSIKY